jgi:predicted RNase H-like nuclease (RuvC/YqgF family)
VKLRSQNTKLTEAIAKLQSSNADLQHEVEEGKAIINQLEAKVEGLQRDLKTSQDMSHDINKMMYEQMAKLKAEAKNP